MAFKIYHDNDPIDILSIVEKELATVGIQVEFKNDELEHDGYMIFNIIKRDVS